MPIIDLSFMLQGDTVPLNHGYSLFSAVSRIVPDMHNQERIGIHPIRGIRNAPGVLSIIPQSRLRLRIESEKIGDFLTLAGSQLNLNGHLLDIGIPRSESLSPATNLASRMVTIKGMMEPEKLLESAKRQLIDLQISGTPELVISGASSTPPAPIRRVLRIQNRTVVGFALHVNGLTAEESIKLQEIGLGGRRHMGCGIFVPY